MTKNNLTTEQQQQLQDIGTKLSRTRLAKDISLDTVANNTHISKRLLVAIEAGETEELPEPIYIKALVTKFARELGVQEIQFEIESQTDSGEKDPRQKSRRQYWLNFQLRSLHLYLIYILLVLASVKGISNLVESPVAIDLPLTPPPEAPTPEEPKTPTPAQVSQTENASQFVSQSSNTESVSVGINLQEKCWLKVMVDGTVAFEGILPKGTQRQWTGKKEVTIRAGNAGGVVISFNNQQQKVLGAPGQVEEITYTVN